MTNNVWTTSFNRPDNCRMFGLSFPGKVDYPTFFYLEHLNNGRSVEQEAQLNKIYDQLIEISEQNNACMKLDPAIIPTTLYGDDVSIYDVFPFFCRTPPGFLLVNSACAELLKQFRLGGTLLHPVDFFDVNLNEPINNETYYYLNISEWRTYFLPELSTKNLEEEHVDFAEVGGPMYSLYHSNYRKNSIAINNTALNCDLDLWHDPTLYGSIFFSDQLKQALDQAGMAKDWFIYQCKIIGHH